MHFQYKCMPVAPAHLQRCCNIFAEMHMVPLLFFQSFFHNSLYPTFGRAMKQYNRWLLCYIIEVDIYRVTLVGPDHCFIFIKTKTLLAVSGNNVFQHFFIEFWKAMTY